MRLRPIAALRTARLILTPLQLTDALEMVEVLVDEELYTFTGGCPPTLDRLVSLYRSQVVGPPEGDEDWHNWILRLREAETAIGFVQATVVADRADIAWLVGVKWQGKGFATEASLAIRDWLASLGVEHFRAHIHPGHAISGRVAAAVGMSATDEVDDDGEVIWTSATFQPPG